MQDILGMNLIEKPKFTLNSGQEQALDGLLRWVKDSSDNRHACLIGQAGVGKSFLTALFLGECQDIFGAYAIQATSTTHKASSVLKKFMLNNDLSAIETGTVHSYLGMSMQANGKTKKLKRGTKPPRRIKLLVVEEASMIADDLYQYILDDYGDCYDKILFIGDALQLPPVNNLGNSKAFDSELKFELTQIVRQGEGNPIISLGDHLRDCILNSKVPELESNVIGGVGVACIGKGKFERLMYSMYDKPDAMDNPDLCRSVAWTNAEVTNTNYRIKKEIYGDEYARYNVTDTVVTYQPIMDKFSHKKDIITNNCEELTVTDVQFGAHPKFGDIDCDILQLKGEDGKIVDAYVVCKDDEEMYNKELNKLSKAKQWKKFWDLKEFCDIVEPAYSLTSHKSQGSSFKNVFVNQRNMKSILDMELTAPCKTRLLTRKEKLDTYLRCLYVGVTRATDRAYILK